MADDSEKKTVVKIEHEGSSEKPSNDKPKFEALSLEERIWLISRLESLRYRGMREYPSWKAELVTVLKSAPILEPILDMLEAENLRYVSPSTKRVGQRIREIVTSDSFEKKMAQVIDAALRVVGGSVTPTLGEGLRYLVAQEVETVIWQSKTVMVIRWGAVALTSLVAVTALGGTFWGAAKVEGLIKLAENAEVNIQKTINTVRDDIQKNLNTARDDMQRSLTSVRDEADKAQANLRTVRDEATGNIDKRINDEVAARTRRLDDIFTKAGEEANAKLIALDTSLGKLKSEYEDQSRMHFAAHKDATGALWEIREKDWIEVLTTRTNSVNANVDNSAQAFNTNLDTTLSEARGKTPELVAKINALDSKVSALESKIRAFEPQLTKTATAMGELGGQIAKLKETNESLDELTQKLNEQSQTIGFKWLIRVLEIKDGLAVLALAIAFVSLVYAFFSRRRLLRTKVV